MKVATCEGLNVKVSRENKKNEGQTVISDAFAALISGLMNLESKVVGEIPYSDFAAVCGIQNGSSAVALKSIKQSTVDGLPNIWDNVSEGTDSDSKVTKTGSLENPDGEGKPYVQMNAEATLQQGPKEDTNDLVETKGFVKGEVKDIPSNINTYRADIGKNQETVSGSTLTLEQQSKFLNEQIDSNGDNPVYSSPFINQKVSKVHYHGPMEKQIFRKTENGIGKMKAPDAEVSLDEGKKIQLHNTKLDSVQGLADVQSIQNSDETIPILAKDDKMQYVSKAVGGDKNGFISSGSEKTVQIRYDINRNAVNYVNQFAEYTDAGLQSHNVPLYKENQDFESSLMTLRVISARISSVNVKDISSDTIMDGENQVFTDVKGTNGVGGTHQVSYDEDYLISIHEVQVDKKKDEKDANIIDNKDHIKLDEKHDTILNSSISARAQAEFKDMDVNGSSKQTILYEKNDVLNQVLDKVKFIKAQDGSELQVSLRPEELGHVTIRLLTEKGAVAGRILVENGYVKEVIESNLPQVKENLKNQGINVSQINVFVGSGQEGSPFDRGFNSHKWLTNKRSRFNINSTVPVDRTNLRVEIYDNKGLNYLV